MERKFSTSMTGEELIDWLKSKRLHIEDREKIRKARFDGRSFVRLQIDDFKELGIVIGSRYLLEDLVKEAKKDANPTNNKDTDKSKVVSIEHIGGFSVKTLVVELERLVQWQTFGIYMNVEPHVLNKIEKDNVSDTDAQKAALFQHLILNQKKLGVSWESVCAALETYEGNLAERLKKKYCTDAYANSDVEEPEITVKNASKFMQVHATDYEGNLAERLKKKYCTDAYANSDVEEPEITVKDTTRLHISDLKRIQRATWDVRSKWKSLGVELGIVAPTLDAIEARCHWNPDDCYQQLLSTWLCGDTPKPTISNLTEALKAKTVNYGFLAANLN